ncbi:GPP34 family phosphoprotein [Lentisphaerota bacterium ZTH]|nr:GPP34 family phosphoprotein [Lentisphaerota bacterium]WET07598.1 GPP34 family phosphoprotein [Lentisphaerota bacterium ZTH]
MLSFAEEIYLLALDDITGKVVISSTDVVFDAVMVGAVLSELSFNNRIDTDQEELYILNTEYTGFPVLDSVIDIFRETDKKETSIKHCLQVLMPYARELEKKVLGQLIKKGILKKVEEKILWFFPSRRYPIIDNTEIVDVETRLRNIVMTNEIPSPRDAVLISLVDASGLFHEILSPREYRRCKERIIQLAKLDNVGRKVHEMIKQIRDYANMPPYV